MSNVQYRCAVKENGEPGCGGRMFARPGGTKMECHRCGGKYKQTEVSHAPDFGFYDPNAGVNQSVTGHSAAGMKGGVKPVAPNEAKVKKATELDLADYDQLVALYMEKYRERPDGRWGLERLKAEVEKAVAAEPDPADDLPRDSSPDDESDTELASDDSSDTDTVIKEDDDAEDHSTV